MRLCSGRLFGDVVGINIVAGLTLTETLYEHNLHLPKHSHEQAYFCFVLRGSYREVYGQRSRECLPLTFVFHPSGETHSDSFHTNTRCFNILMGEGWLERAREQSRAANSSADFRGGALPRLAMRVYKEYCAPDKFSALTIEGLTLEIIAEVGRRASDKTEREPPQWLRKAREILHHCHLEQMSVVSVAQTVGVHPTHLAREFRRFYRCTMGEYIREQRIEFARQQLTTSDAPISEIALAAGFFDQSHFARAFKLLTSMTPNQYRRSFRPR